MIPKPKIEPGDILTCIEHYCLSDREKIIDEFHPGMCIMVVSLIDNGIGYKVKYLLGELLKETWISTEFEDKWELYR